jgi:hypothetical protein
VVAPLLRYTGPISALARLNLRECATRRPRLGRAKLLVVAGGRLRGAL